VGGLDSVDNERRHAPDRQARGLRHEMSQTERRLWYRLRDRQVSGAKFRRQVPIGPYFVDFACLSARLVVEVDGDHHDALRQADAVRDRWLGEQGYQVLRFWANEIDEFLEEVVEAIADALPDAASAPHPTSPRLRGEE